MTDINFHVNMQQKLLASLIFMHFDKKLLKNR